MSQKEKMFFIKLLLNILKQNFLTYDWFCADGSHIGADNPDIYYPNIL